MNTRELKFKYVKTHLSEVILDRLQKTIVVQTLSYLLQKGWSTI